MRAKLLLVMTISTTPTFALVVDPGAGARAFRACSACHSLEPGRT